MASNVYASDCIHVAYGIHVFYEEIPAANGAVATGGEPHLDLSFVYLAGGQILPRSRVVRRRRLAVCNLATLRGFITEQERVPMELLIDPDVAEQAREYICNLIFFLVQQCRRGAGEPVKSLRVGITVEVLEKEENDAKFLSERRMSRVISYVYSGGRGGSPEKAEKEGGGGGGEEEEICAVCLDEMKVGAEVAGTPCGHRFHAPCLRLWFKKAGLCPLCRFMIDS